MLILLKTIRLVVVLKGVGDHWDWFWVQVGHQLDFLQLFSFYIWQQLDPLIRLAVNGYVAGQANYGLYCY